jgi:hypothetical protein
MPRAKLLFRKTEVARVVAAVEKATGQKVTRVEVDPTTGRIIAFPGNDATTPMHNEWDEAAE